MAELVRMPKLGFDMQEGLLVRWVKFEGDQVVKGDILAEIETDKATVEVEASVNGIMYKQVVDVDTSVPIGDPIAVLAESKDEKIDLQALLGSKTSDEKDAEAVISEEIEPIEAKAAQKEMPGGRIKASPLAKRIAKENNLNLSEVKASGPSGRIVKKDIEAALQVLDSQKVQSSSPVWRPVSQAPGDKLVPLSKLRQAIGRRLVESKQSIPHFYVTSKVRMDALMNLRKEANAALPEEQKLSVNDFIIKAVALTLRAFPMVNASLTGDAIQEHGSVNVGVAVSVDDGLLTVVVRDSDLKPMRIISEEVKAMAGRVRSGKVKPEDVEGSTFSISNMGMYDVENFAAIINPPEAAILAVSSAQSVPVVNDGEVSVGLEMKMTLSADHRVIDGVLAAQFMKHMKELLESPIKLLL